MKINKILNYNKEIFDIFTKKQEYDDKKIGMVDFYINFP